MRSWARLGRIIITLMRYGVDDLVLANAPQPWLKAVRWRVTRGRRFEAPRGERLRLLTAQVDKLLTEARQLDFDIDTVMELIEKRHKQRGRDSE